MLFGSNIIYPLCAKTLLTCYWSSIPDYVGQHDISVCVPNNDRVMLRIEYPPLWFALGERRLVVAAQRVSYPYFFSPYVRRSPFEDCAFFPSGGRSDSPSRLPLFFFILSCIGGELLQLQEPSLSI